APAARPFPRQRERWRRAAQRVEEVELEAPLDVGAAHAERRVSCAAAAAVEAAEQIVEVVEVEALGARRRAAARSTASEARLEALLRLARALRVEAPFERHLAEFVVVATLLGIREHVVGARDLLEAVLGGLVAGIHVRVVLARELAIGSAQRVGIGIARDAEDLVEVARGLSHRRLRASSCASGRRSHRTLLVSRVRTRARRLGAWCPRGARAARSARPPRS